MSQQSEVSSLIHEANRLRFESPQEARRLYTQAIELAHQDNLWRELIHALKGRGQIERDLNNNKAAVGLYEQAAALCREAGDPLLLAHTVRHVGDIHQDIKHDDLAAACYVEALAIYRAEPNTAPLDLANAVRPFALLKENAGEIEEAKRLWAEARDLYAASNIPQGVAECSRRLRRLESKPTPHPIRLEQEH
jgi:tetratricopeptide (TPR) repeat protein